MIRIDWTNPITKGLVFASVGSQPDINLVDGARPSDGTTFAVRPGADGLGLDPDDLTFAPTDGSFWNKWHDSGRTFGFATYSLLLREVDTGSNDTILEIKINNNRHTLRFVNAAQNETISVSYYDTTETQINAGPVTTPVVIDGKAHGAACSCESDGTLTLYGDGISIGTPGTTSNPGFLAQTLNNGFGVGNDWTGGTDWPGLIYLSLLWTRPLSAVEHAQLHANPWQIFIDTSRPIIGAHQLPENVNWVYKQDTTQGIHGYTIDFDKMRHVWTGATDTYKTHGILATGDSHTFRVVDTAYGGALSIDDDSVAIPQLYLSPSYFGNFGPHQFCEGEIYIPATGGNPWCGVSVFNGGDKADTSTNLNHLYAILCTSSGTGTSGYRLYKYSGAWSFVQSTTAADPAEKPVRLRIEARDRGDATVVDWWIDGQQQTQWVDSLTTRITWKSSVVPHTAPGISYGNGGSNDTLRYILWFRGGALPEVKGSQEVMVPINEDLPELGTFEKPWDDMPL